MEEGREQGKDPAISVVIPCFRAGELLSEAIESVLAQTETDWELILVDNNASEETQEVIKRYVERFPEKIRVVCEQDPGVCSARNRGILEAFGKYIALLDDDDMMYPKRLALQKEVLEKHSDAALCYGKVDWVTYDNTAVVKAGAWDSDFPFFRKSGRLLSTRGVCLNFPEPRPSSVMFKRSVAVDIGLFDRHFNPILLEDTDFYFRMAQRGEFIEIPVPLVRYRLPSSEFLKKKRIDNVRKFRLMLNQDYFYSKIIIFLKNHNLFENPRVQEDLKRMKARWLREISFDFLSMPKGEPFARILLWKAIQENPLDFRSVKHLLRSYYPISVRTKKYANGEVPDQGVPEELTETFFLSLFKGDHSCKFCRSSQNAGQD